MDREPNQENARRLTPEERAARVKKLKQKRRVRLAIVITAFLLLLALIISPIVLFFVLRVKDFALEGISPYHGYEIIEASGVTEGKSLIFLSVDKIEENIEKTLPYTDDVEVTRKFPDTLVIRYGETSKAFAFQLSGSSYALTDSNLKVLEHASEVPEGLTLIKGATPVKYDTGEVMSFAVNEDGEEISTDRTFSLVLEITKSVAENSMKDVNLIDVSSVNDIYLIYQGRLVLRLGESSDISSKLSLGQRVIADEDKIDPMQSATVNLTIPKKAYVNPADPEDIKELVIYNGGEWEEPERVDPEESTEPDTEESTEKAENEDE